MGAAELALHVGDDRGVPILLDRQPDDHAVDLPTRQPHVMQGATEEGQVLRRGEVAVVQHAAEETRRGNQRLGPNMIGLPIDLDWCHVESPHDAAIDIVVAVALGSRGRERVTRQIPGSGQMALAVLHVPVAQVDGSRQEFHRGVLRFVLERQCDTAARGCGASARGKGGFSTCAAQE